MASQGNGSRFGKCCTELGELLVTEEFDAFFQVDDDGVLYMAVGASTSEDEQSGEIDTELLDHPGYFCPFCGTKLQTPEEVEQLIG